MSYEYCCFISRVVDGDTVIGDISLTPFIPPSSYEGWTDSGFNVWVNPARSQIVLRDQRIRLDGLNAEEVKTLAGKTASDWLRDRIQKKVVALHTFKAKAGSKTDNYGRYVGVLYVDGVCVNQELIEKGYAVKKNYR